jgi:Fe-S cluster assembly protein SufD
LDDEAVGHFSGKITVVPDAQRTDAFQANHNLLLSQQARIHTDPQLEIYADDVKCSHGATVGRLQPEELFYLRSRGIPKKEAELLQQLAFAYAVLEKIPNEILRERMMEMVEKRLRGGC